MKLKNKLHISEVEFLLKELLPLLESSQDVFIDIDDVEEVDTASVQVLCSLQKSLSLTSSKITWVGHSDAFKKATQTLGVADFLSI